MRDMIFPSGCCSCRFTGCQRQGDVYFRIGKLIGAEKDVYCRFKNRPDINWRSLHVIMILPIAQLVILYGVFRLTKIKTSSANTRPTVSISRVKGHTVFFNKFNNLQTPVPVFGRFRLFHKSPIQIFSDAGINVN